MSRGWARALGAGAAAIAGILVALVPAGPATAADKDLGWVRLQPATGQTDIAVLALTESACPGGEAVTARLSGPRISATAGNLVGVTEYGAFKPTLTGQLWIPLAFTFRDWSNVNGVRLKPGARYDITVVCRDLLRSSQTSGAFTGQVVFDGKGGYRALGEAAAAFDTELKPEDPFALPTAAPTAGAGAQPGASSAPAPVSSPAASEPAPAASGGAVTTTEPRTPSSGPAIVGAPAVQPAADATASDSGVRNLLLGAAVLLLVGLAVIGVLRRPTRDEPTGARERVDVH